MRLLDAVTTIKEECKKHTRCEECPVYSEKYKECGTAAFPEHWETESSPLKDHVFK